MATGRTVQDFVSFVISNAAGDTMMTIPIDSIGDVGLNYPEEEMAAFSDAIKGILIGKPDFSLDFGGPLDNTATTGAAIVLPALLGGLTCLSFGVMIGIRAAWVNGSPRFGYVGVSASNSGVILTKYKVSNGRFSARINMIAGSAGVPAWATTAITVPA